MGERQQPQKRLLSLVHLLSFFCQHVHRLHSSSSSSHMHSAAATAATATESSSSSSVPSSSLTMTRLFLFGLSLLGSRRVSTRIYTVCVPHFFGPNVSTSSSLCSRSLSSLIASSSSRSLGCPPSTPPLNQCYQCLCGVIRCAFLQQQQQSLQSIDENV